MGTEHSKIGPSALYRLLECPGSHKLSANRPQGGSSAYAAEGTVAHTIIENLLGDGQVIEGPVLGDVVSEEGHQIAVDQDMIDGVNQMIAFCEPLKDASDKHWVEARVDLSPLWDGKPPEPIFGTVDFAAHHASEDVLYVVDFKYGRLSVSPHDNPQALAYALGACYELGRFPAQIVLGIVQPRGMDAQPVKIANLSGLDLKIWAEETLKPGVNRLFEDSPALAPGDHCRFCPAKIDCPALYALAKQKARAEFSELPVAPMQLSDADLADVLDWATVLEMWIAEIRAEASGRVEKGNSVPGWKLVPKKGIRKWAKDILPEITDFFQDVSTAWDQKLKTPTQLEKIDPTVYREAVRRNYVDKSSSGTTLVPDHDPREAVASKSAKDEFGEL